MVPDFRTLISMGACSVIILRSNSLVLICDIALPPQNFAVKTEGTAASLPWLHYTMAAPRGKKALAKNCPCQVGLRPQEPLTLPVLPCSPSSASENRI